MAMIKISVPVVKEEERRITPRQLETLKWVAYLYKRRGYAPAISAISEGLGCAGPQGSRRHVDVLCELGLLARDKGITRSTSVTEAGWELLEKCEYDPAGRPGRARHSDGGILSFRLKEKRR